MKRLLLISPKQSEVKVYLRKNDGKAVFSVTSLGPKILLSERKKIFSLFYRGEIIAKIGEEGPGYGLYLCNFIAKNHFKTTIKVDQEGLQVQPDYYKTTFSIEIKIN